MEKKLRMTPEEVVDLIATQVRHARNLCEDVEWSAEDATRSNIDFLCRCVEVAIAQGATTINLPDTVGYTTPAEYAAIFRTVRVRVPNSDKALFSVHCHNDLDMALANTIAGVEAGARQVECTINGIGERAGNTALESIVMALRVRNDILPFVTGIDATQLTRASRLVSEATSFPVQHNKAIVGRNAFRHESGIHQDGMIKDPNTYEIMTPESVGASSKDSIVMGKHSGAAGMRDWLRKHGYPEMDAHVLAEIMVRFNELAGRMKEITNEDIHALISEKVSTRNRIQLHSLSVHSGTGRHHSASVDLNIDDSLVSSDAFSTNGGVDAIAEAIRLVIPNTATFHDYQVRMIGDSAETEAQAECSIRLSVNGKSVSARSADPDTMTASAKAYLDALNKLIALELITLPKK